MKKRKYNEFMKRYDKFKKNNLPTPFWDDERKTLEYVNIGNRKTIYDFDNAKNKMEVYNYLTEALENIGNVGLYYPFTAKYQDLTKDEIKFVVDHTHSYSFENVVGALYQNPESFYISKSDEEFYSKQELRYLKKLQKYLLFIGLKDVETEKIPISRYRNKLHEKYKNAYTNSLEDKILNNILNGKINFTIKKWYKEYQERSYETEDYCRLITDNDYNIKLYIKYTNDEVRLYKDFKDIYPMAGINDSDKVIVEYFKILERF